VYTAHHGGQEESRTVRDWLNRSKSTATIEIIASEQANDDRDPGQIPWQAVVTKDPATSQIKNQQSSIG
jgi:hypothetical protein